MLRWPWADAVSCGKRRDSRGMLKEEEEAYAKRAEGSMENWKNQTERTDLY